MADAYTIGALATQTFTGVIYVLRVGPTNSMSYAEVKHARGRTWARAPRYVVRSGDDECAPCLMK